jgi:hypothetical protein
MSEFDYIGATVKLGGEAPLPHGQSEYEHGDEVYLVSRARISEVDFPEDKDGNILRVHKAKAINAFVVDAEQAERLIAAERERIEGQGSLIAEAERVAKEMNGAGLGVVTR